MIYYFFNFIVNRALQSEAAKNKIKLKEAQVNGQSFEITKKFCYSFVNKSFKIFKIEKIGYSLVLCLIFVNGQSFEIKKNKINDCFNFFLSLDLIGPHNRRREN